MTKNDNKEKTLNQERFLYRGVEYYIKRTVEINDKRNGQVKPWDSSVKISYCLFCGSKMIIPLQQALYRISPYPADKL